MTLTLSKLKSNLDQDILNARKANKDISILLKYDGKYQSNVLFKATDKVDSQIIIEDIKMIMNLEDAKLSDIKVITRY